MPDSQAGRARRGPFAADYGEHAERSAFNALYDRPAVLGLLGDVKLRIEPGFIAFGLVKAAR